VKQPRLITLLRAALAARRYRSKVWVFNNMPAGARVDTKVSCPLPPHLTTRGILLGVRPAGAKD
jgi:hypothetical protein